MKTKLLSIILTAIFAVSGFTVPVYAYSYFCEEIDFNSFISSDYSASSTGAKYGSFSDYETGYPTGGFYSFTADSLDRDGNGKSLKIWRTQQYNNQKVPGVRYTPEQALTGVVYLETSIYVPSTTYTLYSPRGITARLAGNSSVATLLQFTEAGGRMYLWNGSQVVLTDPTDPTWAPDTWYDIKIWYDLDNNDIRFYITDDEGNVIVDKSYDVAADDNIKAGIESFGFVNSWNFKKLYTEINTKNLDYSPVDVTHFDNIRIETLEAMPSEYVTPEFSFTDADGNAVTYLTKGADINMTATLQTETHGLKNAYVYLAVYDESDKLCALDFNATAFTPEGKAETLSVAVPSGEGTYTLKAAVWKENLTPVIAETLTTP